MLVARPCLLPADDASESMVVAREDNEEDGEVGASESKVSREVIVARDDREFDGECDEVEVGDESAGVPGSLYALQMWYAAMSSVGEIWYGSDMAGSRGAAASSPGSGTSTTLGGGSGN